MKKLLIPLGLLFTISCAFTSSQKNTVEGTNSLLWEISGNGLKQKSYVFGTIHIIHKDDFFFPDEYLEALKSTEKLVMEIDLTDMMGQLSVMKKMNLDSNRTLEDLYSEEDYNFIKKTAMDSFDVNINFFKSMKPIFVQQTIVSQNILGSDTKSYELYLMSKALGKGMSVAGLETAAEQMEILDSIPLDVQADMLLQSMHEIHESRTGLDKMVKQYKAENLDSLYALFQEEDEISDYSSSLLDNRNRKWIPMMEAYMQEESVFIAVGAGHLGGPNGILNLLRQKGYTVTPVTQQ